MLKKKNFILFGTAAVLAAGLLAGCGSSANTDSTTQTGETTTAAEGTLTAESLCKEVSEKMNDIKSYSFDTKTKIDYSVAAEGIDMTMKMDAVMEGETVTESKESHIKFDYNASMLGQEIKAENEAYASIADDGSYVTYSKTEKDGEEGKWTKNESETPIDLDNIRNADIYKQIADGKINAVLTDGNDKVNGKDVYKIETTLPGEIFEEVYSNMYGGGSETSDAFSGADFSKVNAKTELYIYKDSRLPARTYMDIREYGETLMEQAMSSGGSTQNYTMSFEDFSVDMTTDNYNTIDKIVIPDEVLKEAGN
jgi:outer membrane murein-binding lipoprotein Lpp